MAADVSLRTVGVTGTNGKTTTTAWIAAALRACGLGPVPRVTTVGAFLDDEPLGTPETFGAFLDVMRAAKARGSVAAAIELTSEALAMGFAARWPCEVGVLTNVTRDHLDAHGIPEHYLASKAQLFVRLLPAGTAVLNGCDPAAELIAEIVPPGRSILRFGCADRGRAHAPLDLEAIDVRVTREGTQFRVVLSAALDRARGTTRATRAASVRAIGSVFAENAIAAALGAHALGAPIDRAIDAIAEAPPPPGRFEVVLRAPLTVVDYAHSPDAIARTVATARAIAGVDRVWIVFGAGGDRDPGKRGAMGRAARGADHIVLTTDNPRSEDPGQITTDLRAGAGDHPGVHVELDRAAAITWAVTRANERDVVVIAGRGHETHQIFAEGPRPFSDVTFLRSLDREDAAERSEAAPR